MKSKKARWIIISSIVSIIILVATAKHTYDDGTKGYIETVSKNTITETVTVSGKIHSETEVKLTPEVSGENVVIISLGTVSI
jgi:multidrug efflux pump subunit AcrA (membrane-fusion protein)